MTLEKITTSEFPSQSPPSDLCVNSLLVLDHNFCNLQAQTEAVQDQLCLFHKSDSWSLTDTQVRQLLLLSSHFPYHCMIKSLLFLCIVVSMKITFRKKKSGKYILNNLIP